MLRCGAPQLMLLPLLLPQFITRLPLVLSLAASAAASLLGRPAGQVPQAPCSPLVLQSKIDLYVNRYQLVLQRLRRNRLFRAADFAVQLDPARAEAGCEVGGCKGRRRAWHGQVPCGGDGKKARKEATKKGPWIPFEGVLLSRARGWAEGTGNSSRSTRLLHHCGMTIGCQSEVVAKRQACCS
jgi:hypothetical protein